MMISYITFELVVCTLVHCHASHLRNVSVVSVVAEVISLSFLSFIKRAHTTDIQQTGC